MGTLPYFDLQPFIETYGARVFVETGSAEGGGVEYARTFPFSKIYSSEIVKVQAERLQQRFADDNRVEITAGNSYEFLQNLLPHVSENAVFWLDAHYPGADLGLNDYDFEENLDLQLPLEKELDVLWELRGNFRDVIICDDLRIYEHITGDGNNLDEIGLSHIAKYGSNIFSRFEERYMLKRIYTDTGYVVMLPK